LSTILPRPMSPSARSVAARRPPFAALQRSAVVAAFTRVMSAPVGTAEYTRRRTDLMRDLSARLFVGALFALMSWNLLGDFRRTGHVTGLLLLASESLVVVLTIFRRRAYVTDRSVMAAVATTLSLAGPPLVRSAQAVPITPDVVTALISGAGLLLVIAAKMTLGRSFGIAPANRGVVARGPYTFVRHPIYTGYMITHVAFLMAHPSAWNAAVLTVADLALVVRALLEERVLGDDERYRTYCTRVTWHLVPGVF
jgi:protein-S-isoprenylcysteine O-methyltransferase Ste14